MASGGHGGGLVPSLTRSVEDPVAYHDRDLVLELDDELLLHITELVDLHRRVPHDTLVKGLVVAFPCQFDLGEVRRVPCNTGRDEPAYERTSLVEGV